MNRSAGYTSNTVPWEILRAGGYNPRLLDSEPGPTPCADRLMENVFDRRIRVIFDRLCTGMWSDLEVVVLPRSSEQEHKLYLYLKEAARLHAARHMPRLYLYNILHSRSPESRAYGLERTRRMAADFAASEKDLVDAIAESNRARAAVRGILRLREEGQMEGSAALRLIRGFYAANRKVFIEEARRQIQERQSLSPRARPRILIKGAALDHVALHLLVERSGGYVIAEDDWHGSRAAGDLDIREDGDPVTAIFEKYFYDAVSPRVHPPEEADGWYRRETERLQIEGVVFYIPLQDDVVGWDYPRHRAFLDSLGVPSTIVRESGDPEPGRALTEQVGTFISSLRRV